MITSVIGMESFFRGECGATDVYWRDLALVTPSVNADARMLAPKSLEILCRCNCHKYM